MGKKSSGSVGIGGSSVEKDDKDDRKRGLGPSDGTGVGAGEGRSVSEAISTRKKVIIGATSATAAIPWTVGV